MNIVFRTDASINIGTGHVMRCLTLADELRQKGTDVNFICCEEPGNLISYIENRGYKVHQLPGEIDIETDRRLNKEILSKYETRPDLLLVRDNKCYNINGTLYYGTETAFLQIRNR